ncbi:MAG: porin [Limnobacter sp.]|nr:porin [Limnobacter sp.]
MNKKLLAATLGLAFAAPAFADSSSVVLYGRLHQALELNSVDTGVAGGDRTSDMNLAGYSSRIGVNVKEDLGGGLSFIGGYEWGTNVEAAGNTIAGRNAFVGMAGSFGRVTAGIQDGGNGTVAPLYVQASKYHLNGQNNAGSLTNIGSADFTPATPGATDAVINRKQRADNSLGYAGSFGGLNVTARHSMAGANQAAGSATGTENDVTLSEAAVDYKIGNLEIGGGVATYRYEAPEPAGSIDNVYQLGAKYTFGALSLAGLYGSSSFNGAGQADRDDFGVSAEYKLTANAGITASYGDAELSGSRDANQAQVIGYYDFSKRTRAYAGLNRTTFDNVANAAETDVQSVVMGLRHNF